MQSIGAELEALVRILRALAGAKLGDNPLAGSIYALRDEGEGEA